jgi:hypothetical protein
MPWYAHADWAIWVKLILVQQVSIESLRNHPELLLGRLRRGTQFQLERDGVGGGCEALRISGNFATDSGEVWGRVDWFGFFRRK